MNCWSINSDRSHTSWASVAHDWPKYGSKVRFLAERTHASRHTNAWDVEARLRVRGVSCRRLLNRTVDEASSVGKVGLSYQVELFWAIIARHAGMRPTAYSEGTANNASLLSIMFLGGVCFA